MGSFSASGSYGSGISSSYEAYSDESRSDTSSRSGSASSSDSTSSNRATLEERLERLYDLYIGADSSDPVFPQFYDRNLTDVDHFRFYHSHDRIHSADISSYTLPEQADRLAELHQCIFLQISAMFPMVEDDDGETPLDAPTRELIVEALGQTLPDIPVAAKLAKSILLESSCRHLEVPSSESTVTHNHPSYSGLPVSELSDKKKACVLAELFLCAISTFADIAALALSTESLDEEAGAALARDLFTDIEQGDRIARALHPLGEPMLDRWNVGNSA